MRIDKDTVITVSVIGIVMFVVYSIVSNPKSVFKTLGWAVEKYNTTKNSSVVAYNEFKDGKYNTKEGRKSK